MKLLLKNANLYLDGKFERMDLCIDGPVISELGRLLPEKDCDVVVSLDRKYIVPGFADVHVHLREPGFSYKETIRTGTQAAARGGYTALCAMPNLAPPPDTAEHLKVQTDRIERDACCHVLPFGAITKGQTGRGELSDMQALAPFVAGFSDDGKGVQDAGLMRLAMQRAKQLGKVLSAHCEDESLLGGGSLHDGIYARSHGLKGIPSESEFRQVARDLALAAETGCAYHVCHVSTKESVDLIRKAKKNGVDVTCETAPHYLVLCEDDLKDDGRYKMNPPLRSSDDRTALVEGVCDGTIDMIATDHAPHSAEEKQQGLAGSAMGIVGLECAFPILYTELVQKGVIGFDRLLDMLISAPRKRFALPGGVLAPGAVADLAVLDLDVSYPIDASQFLSKGRSTPFDGWNVCGKVDMTLCRGEIIWKSPAC